MIRLAITAAALVASTSAFAETIAGRASVIDGDTIEIHGERIRLNGIDAPESRQFCLDDRGAEYRCGRAAADALDAFLADRRPISCEVVDIDRYGRYVAICSAAGIDVSGWLVREGHALDWERYSKGKYSGDQAAARQARRGMWAGLFARPWEWRRGRKTAPLIGVNDLGE